MTAVMKIFLCTVVLFANAFACENDIPVVTKDTPGSTEPRPSHRTFVGTTLRCEASCEIRSSGGECKVNFKCLLEKLFSSKGTQPSFAMRPEGDRVDTHSYAGQDEDEQKCQGKCLFTDKKDNCRLDLICALNRDVEGTLRFLMDFNVDAKTAIQLALSASSNDPRDSCNEPVMPSPDPSEGHCCNPSEAGKDCGNVEECPEGPGPINFNHKPEVSNPPLRDCPGKCEVRDALDAGCIIDYDCVNNLA